MTKALKDYKYSLLDEIWISSVKFELLVASYGPDTRIDVLLLGELESTRVSMQCSKLEYSSDVR